MAELNETIELARKVIAAHDAGKPVGLAVIATLDGNTTWSFMGYDAMTAHHLTARFEHWQLARLAKLDLMTEGVANMNEPEVETVKREVVK